MKAILDKFLWKIGFYSPIPLAPSRAFVDGPYANCYDMARNQACSIILDDNEFEITDGPSFYMMHREIYSDQSYLFRSQRDVPVIIDCGSNYGVSILWFKKSYPDAKIVGVEADPVVFDMLFRNISRRNFSDVKLLHRAVSSKSGHIPFHCLGADSGRIHAGSPDGISSSTEVIDVPQQLSRLLSILEDNGFRYYIDKVCSPQNPYLEITINQGMDLQLRIFATRPDVLQAAGAGQPPA
jgi:FkbM family methyltransferase